LRLVEYTVEVREHIRQYLLPLHHQVHLFLEDARVQHSRSQFGVRQVRHRQILAHVGRQLLEVEIVGLTTVSTTQYPLQLDLVHRGYAKHLLRQILLGLRCHQQHKETKRVLLTR
jgi:hypothetical protein